MNAQLQTILQTATADTIYLELAGKVSELEQAILAEHPQMPTLLRQIHSSLLQNPAAIHSLSDDQIATVIRGLTDYTNTEIIASAPKPKKTSLKGITVDDL
jgi:hypothetical protein